MQTEQKNTALTWASLAFFSLPLRLVFAWAYFSAFWRRLVLADKLDPDAAGYIGEKFNHFLPHALGIGPLIEYLVSNPDLLWWNMLFFTLIEGLAGLALLLGFFTRLASLVLFGLALGVLLGAGWIGSTCLDEWQIGTLGMASAWLLVLSGASAYSLDAYLINKNKGLSRWRLFPYLASGGLPQKLLQRLGLGGAVFIFALTLYTNQHFHGGLYGTLHNKSVKPRVELGEVFLQERDLSFELMRVEGIDVYGSFLTDIFVEDAQGAVLRHWSQADLAAFGEREIENYYVAKVRASRQSLVLPLGAKARIRLTLPEAEGKQELRLRLRDISGLEWSSAILPSE